VYSAASAFTCSSEKPGPPSSLKVAEGQQPGRVAARADFAEHLEAALQLVLVICAEQAGEAPVLLFGSIVSCLCAIGRSGRPQGHQAGSENGRDLDHSVASFRQFVAGGGLSTASEMESAAAAASRNGRAAAG
jgi:hypothetical protein